LRTAREGRLLSPSLVRRALTVSRMLAPVLVPIAYRAAMAAQMLNEIKEAAGARHGGSKLRVV
jgi:hypothetical protein